MSNKEETFARIRLAQEKGYELMAAVLTPPKLPLAADGRAKELAVSASKAPTESHGFFASFFKEYEAVFEEITVFAKVETRIRS